MRKTLLSLALLAVSSLTVLAEETVQYLAVSKADGTTVMFPLQNKPTIQAENGVMTIRGRVNDQTVTLQLTPDDLRVAKQLSEADATGIRETLTSGQRVNFDAASMILTGLQAGERVEVMSVGGSRVGESQANAAGVAVVSLRQLPQGIYLLKTRQQSFKVMNQ